jgi:hypothetical protein
VAAGENFAEFWRFGRHLGQNRGFVAALKKIKVFPFFPLTDYFQVLYFACAQGPGI